MHGLRSSGTWVLAAAAAGFLSAAAFTMVLGLDRRAFVAAWSAVAALLWAAYARNEQVRLRVQLARRLPAGIVVDSVLALAGSALVTAAYHAGFREFQGPQLLLPVLSNVGMTACYLISGSAAAPIVAHVAMHVAAVVHGAATTVQLPPHYA